MLAYTVPLLGSPLPPSFVYPLVLFTVLTETRPLRRTSKFFYVVWCFDLSEQIERHSLQL